MHNSAGRYVLGMEVMTPTGMNLDIATSVANADLARFDQVVGEDGIERFTFAKIEYTKESDLFEKTCELTANLLDSLLTQLPRSLKPIPLLIAVPTAISLVKMQEWLGESDYSDFLSVVEAVHASGPSFVLQAMKSLDKYDAMMCISVDSMVNRIQELIDDTMVMSTNNPWGVIPSEGGAGLILCRRNTVETLKLKPLAQLGYIDTELNTSDRRGMYRLVQRASKKLTAFGEVYSDMTNLRAHSEDYGFALGAKAERFINPEQPLLINELWGTMGNCSSLALGAFAVKNHHFNQPVTLLMFDFGGDKALLQLLAC
ncbi:hypothetical protein CGH51_17655 [Vibrio parahaemolyticus]|uniref:hypothetical protein n=1 Tax=Vibrio parahaemolyticus TaxID=670 RepID=UPI001120D03B|nr:hypothetical protein [Vibrio parahaemolyticus]TON69895.1 hypothetical protein CGH51_17655 [Vibrio parahaemolyticus]HCG8031874.1 hypothetical protein [Vibrio parahaemolyticus]HCG8052577.1 hypothetical protein [Vibrio parahaemolyticus]HCG8067989.1 hypothetical protein [Vibrio parahaemolyticus]HCH0776775.1 hypothetical protein [Vibrio parahaemolyticus]